MKTEKLKIKAGEIRVGDEIVAPSSEYDYYTADVVRRDGDYVICYEEQYTYHKDVEVLVHRRVE